MLLGGYQASGGSAFVGCEVALRYSGERRLGVGQVRGGLAVVRCEVLGCLSGEGCLWPSSGERWRWRALGGGVAWRLSGER